MPQLDYKHAVGARSVFATSGGFYDGSEGRQLVSCPRCRWPADVMFGDHGDDERCAQLGRENAVVKKRKGAA